METMAQRIEALRTEKGLSRPALASALGLGKHVIEKFETGRQTPTREQQERMADYFGVSTLYLRGESSDRTRQGDWLEGDVPDNGPGRLPRHDAPAPRPAPAAHAGGGQGLFDAFLASRAFQEQLHRAVLDVLRSPEGQELLTRAVRRELMDQKQPQSTGR